MQDAELIERFIQIEQTADQITFSVESITWDGHEPISWWHPVETLAATATPAQQEAVLQKILHDSSYFGVCKDCQERNPRGWMHDYDLCQSCAQNKHGWDY